MKKLFVSGFILVFALVFGFGSALAAVHQGNSIDAPKMFQTNTSPVQAFLTAYETNMPAAKTVRNIYSLAIDIRSWPGIVANAKEISQANSGLYYIAARPTALQAEDAINIVQIRAGLLVATEVIVLKYPMVAISAGNNTPYFDTTFSRRDGCLIVANEVSVLKYPGMALNTDQTALCPDSETRILAPNDRSWIARAPANLIVVSSAQIHSTS